MDSALFFAADNWPANPTGATLARRHDDPPDDPPTWEVHWEQRIQPNNGISIRIIKKHVLVSYRSVQNTPMGINTIITARTDGSSAPRHPLPPLPEGLAWPDHDYVEGKVPEFGVKHGLARYIECVWKPLFPHITMPVLRANYPKLARAIDIHRFRLVASGVDLPLVKKEVTDRVVAACPNPADLPQHVKRTLQSRTRDARRRAASAEF